MLAGGETVLVAVSGGADSVALLHVLHRLAPEWRLSLHALYVDHQLRPDSARDGEVVRRAGRAARDSRRRRHGRPSPRAARARPRRGSPAIAPWRTHADRVGAQRIAVAHTADDQAETVLMRLLEGTGVRGLAGIPPTPGPHHPPPPRPSAATRCAPLLVEAGIEWIEDPSNADRAFLRNRIRHELLPALREAYNPGDRGGPGPPGRAGPRDHERRVESVAARELARLARAGPAELILAARRAAGAARRGRRGGAASGRGAAGEPRRPPRLGPSRSPARTGAPRAPPPLHARRGDASRSAATTCASGSGPASPDR